MNSFLRAKEMCQLDLVPGMTRHTMTEWLVDLADLALHGLPFAIFKAKWEAFGLIKPETMECVANLFTKTT